MKRILYMLIVVIFATNADMQAQCNLILTTQTTNTCAGSANGRAIVNVGGGTANYSYTWSNSSSTAAVTVTSDTISNLTAGTYTVTVTDGNSCIDSTTATIASMPIPAAPTGVSAMASSICPGDSSNLTAIGANATDSIKWYDAMTAGVLLNTMISGGSYNVTPTSTQTYYAEVKGTIGNSQTFGFSGAVDSFIVPAGVSNIDITAMGAQGGSAIDVLTTNDGGLGGSATGTLAVSPGQIIYITVGGQGDTAGGYNGGGTGGYGTAGASCFGGYGGGGGGASDVRVGANTLAARVVVAAGGGGAGRDYCNGTCQPCGSGGGGGGAGGAVGTDGDASSDPTFNQYAGAGINGGKGALQTAGGAGGTGDNSGPSGFAGTIGMGGSGADGDYDIAGGGGGGGYYGGGGGGSALSGDGVAAGGGGGGSSYIGGLTAASTSAGVNTGNGIVTISWETPGCPSPRVSTTVTVTTIDKTVSVSGRTITSNEPGPATYQWLNNAMAINGATNVSYTVPDSDNGNFTVAITKSGCVDTSDVTMLFPLGLYSLDNVSSIKIFPNPVIDQLSIKSETPLEGIKLYNSHGKVILTATPNQLKEHALDLSTLASGIYFVQIKDEKGNFVIRKLIRK